MPPSYPPPEGEGTGAGRGGAMCLSALASQRLRIAGGMTCRLRWPAVGAELPVLAVASPADVP